MACGRGACYDGLSRTQLRPGEGWQPDPQCPAGADGLSFFPAAATAGSQPAFRPPKPAEQKGARLPELAELRVGRKERRLYQQAPAASGRANMKVAVESTQWAGAWPQGSESQTASACAAYRDESG
jgi:hypothetical protein